MAKLTLVRDDSKESEEASRLLEANGMSHAEVFVESGYHRLPFLLTEEDAYPFVGLGGINFFVKDEKERYGVVSAKR